MTNRFCLAGFMVVAAILGGSAAMGQAASAPGKPACAGPESGLSSSLLAWTKPPLTATSGHSAKDVDAARLRSGARMHLKLVKLDTVTFPVAPGGAPQPQQYVYAGLASFQVPKDGTYSIATDEGMRIDVVQNGILVESTAFGHGPDCSTIKKKVEFPLHAGPAVLELYGAPYATVDVLLVPAQ